MIGSLSVLPVVAQALVGVGLTLPLLLYAYLRWRPDAWDAPYTHLSAVVTETTVREDD